MQLGQTIDERSGFGKYQFETCIVLSLISVYNGAQLIFNSFLNPIFAAVFPNVDPATLELVTTLFYVGMMLGAFASGPLADKFGRRQLIVFGTYLQLCVAVAFHLWDGLEVWMAVRFIDGFMFGFTVVLTTSLFAEISPARHRGKAILLINFAITIGKLFGVVLWCVLCQGQLVDSNWKMMMVLGQMPNLAALFLFSSKLEESPEYLFATRQVEKGVAVLENILRRNGKRPLAAAERERILQDCESSPNPWASQLLQGPNLRKIVILAVCWLTINFINNGRTDTEVDRLIRAGSLGLYQGIVLVGGELPCLLVSLPVIDNTWMGRRMPLALVFLGAAVCHLVFAVTEWSVVSFVGHFFMTMVYQLLYLLTVESFGTLVRAKGFSLCSGIGRIGAIAEALIILQTGTSERETFYLISAALSLATAMVVLFMVEPAENSEIKKNR